MSHNYLFNCHKQIYNQRGFIVQNFNCNQRSKCDSCVNE